MANHFPPASGSVELTCRLPGPALSECGAGYGVARPKAYADEIKQKFLDGEADIALLDGTVLRVLEAKRAARNSMAGVAGNEEQAYIRLVPGTNVENDKTERFHEVLRKLHSNSTTRPVKELQGFARAALLLLS